MVTKAELLRLAPNARADIVKAIVENWAYAQEVGGLTNPRRIRQFFANTLNETGGFRRLDESLRYTTIGQLRRTWPSRFPTDASARAFIWDPSDPDREDIALANKVYGGRMGNEENGTADDDGWRYRGGGMMQTTGRDGYRAMGFEDNPEALREPVTAFKTAVREWARRDLNPLADRYDTVAIRRKLNGGTIGLADVRIWLGKAEKVWPDDARPPVAVPVPLPQPHPMPVPFPQPTRPAPEAQPPAADDPPAPPDTAPPPSAQAQPGFWWSLWVWLVGLLGLQPKPKE